MVDAACRSHPVYSLPRSRSTSPSQSTIQPGRQVLRGRPFPRYAGRLPGGRGAFGFPCRLRLEWRHGETLAEDYHRSSCGPGTIG